MSETHFTGSNDDYIRGEAEKDLSAVGTAIKRIQEDTGRSFDKAWSKMRAGKPGMFVGKVSGIGLGSVIMADGIYNIVKGYGEEVEDMLFAEQVGRNHVRMFTGVSELAVGAAAVYMGLTMGHFLQR